MLQYTATVSLEKLYNIDERFRLYAISYAEKNNIPVQYALIHPDVEIEAGRILNEDFADGKAKLSIVSGKPHIITVTLGDDSATLEDILNLERSDTEDPPRLTIPPGSNLKTSDGYEVIDVRHHRKE